MTKRFKRYKKKTLTREEEIAKLVRESKRDSYTVSKSGIIISRYR